MNKRVLGSMLNWAGTLAGLAALLFALTGHGPLQTTVAALSVPVGITADGFDPALVTITVDTTVVWTNHTQTSVHLVSGWPFRAYLPLTLSGAGGAGRTPERSLLAHAQNNWADVDIAPGASFEHTFTAAGTFPYYLADRPTVQGRVIVTQDEFDFALAVEPATRSVNPGGSALYSLTVTTLQGSARPVTLEVSGEPAGATISWTANPVTPPADTVLTIATSASSPVGTFSLTVTGTGGGRVHSVPCTLIVTSSSAAWISLSTGITETLEAVYFVDVQKGWVVGADGAIHYSANGGQTWRRQDSGTDEDLDDVFFMDANRGWAVGGKGVILRTADGGDTWEAQASPRSTFLHSVHFVDDDHGWIGGGHYTLSGPPWTFRAYGYVIGSTDGGDSWSLTDYISGRYVQDVTFVDTSNGWLTAQYVDNSTYETIPKIYASSDGGASWSIQAIPLATGSLNAIAFVDTRTGWAVGEGGAILNTANGGQTWNQQTSGVTGELEDVQFVNTTTGWAVGSILHTTDGGQNWTPQSADPACTDLRGLHFLDAGHGWAVGADGVVCRYGS